MNEMYGLDPDTNLDCFGGKTLVQVCIGVNETILNFEPALKITALSKISCARSATTFQSFADHRETAKTLAFFLEDVVVSVQAESDGSITILFQSGGRLQLIEDCKQYEAYIIDSGGRLMVV